MSRSNETDALPNKTQESSATATPPVSETPLKPEIKKPLYTVTVFDTEGNVTTCETEMLPILRAYKYKVPKNGIIGKYGDLTYCPSVEKSETEPLFFRTIGDAVRMGFAPCNNCWTNPDFGDLAVSRWFEYLRASKLYNHEAIAPIDKLKKILPDDPLDRKEEKAKQILADSLHELSDIAPENGEEIAQKIEIAKKAIRKVAWEDPFVDKVFTTVMQKHSEGKWSELKNPFFVDELVFWSFQTEQEKQTLNVIYLSERIGFERKKLIPIIKASINEVRIREQREDEIVVNMQEMLKKFSEASDITIDEIRTINKLTLGLYTIGDLYSRALLSDEHKKAASVIAQKDPILAASLRTTWIEEVMYLDKVGTLDPGEKVDVEETTRAFHYLPEMLTYLSPEELDDFGYFLRHSLSSEGRGRNLGYLIENYPQHIGISIKKFPKELMYGMLQCFREANLVSISTIGNIKLSRDEKRHDFMNSGYLYQVNLAFALSNEMRTKNQLTVESIQDTDDVVELYQGAKQEAKIETVTINAEGQSRRILFVSGVALGFLDSDPKFVKHIIHTIQELPKDQRPNLIVINNLLYGGFENREKGEKTALVQGLDTLEAQFKTGRMILDDFRKLDVPVMLNLGGSDWEIGRDLLLRMLRYQFNLLGHINYFKQDQLQRTIEWQVYDKFVTKVALPYCYRTGTVPTDGELLILYDTYRRYVLAQEAGEKPVIPQKYKDILDFDAIPFPGKKFKDNLIIVDDAIVQLTNKKSGVTETHGMYSSLNFSLSPNPPMYGTPLQSLIQWMKQENVQPSDVVRGSATIMNQHQFIATSVDGERWAESTPAVQQPEVLDKRGRNKRAPDASHRKATTRREFASTGSFMVETTDDGRRIYHALIKGPLLDLANSQDRTTVYLTGDEQIGSVTHRPDLLVKGDDIAKELLSQEKVVFIHGGDNKQAKNYKGKEHQESAVGTLVDIDRQDDLYRYLTFLALDGVSETHLRNNLVKVRILAGNHELNSGFAMYGISHMTALRMAWNNYLTAHNVPPELQDVRMCENVTTEDGSFFRSWSAIEDIAGYTWMFQHLILQQREKKAADMPIMQAKALFEGAARSVKNIQGATFFHYHSPWIYSAFGKVFTISPAKAGQSEFEYVRGYKAQPGALLLHLGGGLPPAFEFLSRKTLIEHTIKDGPFCEQSLNDQGFFTDKDFDPYRHGAMSNVPAFTFEDLRKGKFPQYGPRSALIKYIQDLQDKLPRQTHATFK
jgi:hypothetical protein